jgi:hypothetical protein
MKSYKNFLTEKQIDLDNIVAELKKYTAMDGEWASGVNLSKLFKDINIKEAKRIYPEIFNPGKFASNVYLFRGSAKPLSFFKSLGEPDEVISGDFVKSISDYYYKLKNPKLLSWNDRKYKHYEKVQSWTTFLNVAQHFADSTSSWNQPPFDNKTNIPIVLMLNYGKNKNNIFMNPDWITEISGINEGEVFHKGQTPTVDISVVLDDTFRKLYKDFLEKNNVK